MNEALLNFRAWFQGNGGHIHPDTEIVSAETGVALRTKSRIEDVRIGSNIVSCTTDLIISFQRAQTSPVLKELAHVQGETAGDQIILLRFFVIEQYLLREDSFWWPYFRLLPQPGHEESLHVPFLYDEIDSEWLERTNLGQATRLRKATWKDEYEASIEVLGDSAPGFATKCTL